MNATVEEVEEVVEEMEETTEVAESPWPETWRENITQDEKELAQLGRYKSPTDIWTKARALEQRITSGELKEVTPFPEKGTPAEQLAWREINGLPEAPEKYDLGREIEDTDKAIIDEYLKYAYDNNVSPQDVKTTVEWFYQRRDQDLEAMEQGDSEVAKASEDTLRSEWGGEYRAHMNRIDGLIDTVPKGAEDLLEARMPNGIKLKHSPEAMSFLLDMALQVNPATVLVPGAGDNLAGAIEDRMQEIREIMRTDRKRYDRDERMQKEYGELIAAQQNVKK